MLKLGINNVELSELTNTVLSILGKHAQKLRKHVRANNSSFVTKDIRKTQWKDRSKYLKGTTENILKCLIYNKQRDVFVNLLHNTKGECFEKLNNKISFFGKKHFTVRLKESDKMSSNN